MTLRWYSINKLTMAASEGVDLEFAIVEYSNIQQNKELKLTKTYSDKIKEQAQKCVGHINDFAGGKKIEVWHSDDSKNPFGVSISAKPEPKTDIVLRIGGKVYSTSVKMEGGVQLASGQGSSTAELFEAAATHLNNTNKSKVLKAIIVELRTLPTRMLSQSNLPRIQEESKKKVIDEFIKNGIIIPDKSYDHWLEHNKPALMENLLDFIESDKDFKRALLYESLTGTYTLAKFKGAVADSVISPKGFYVIDNRYVESIFNKVKFDIRGKSRSGITGIAFRIDLKG